MVQLGKGAVSFYDNTDLLVINCRVSVWWNQIMLWRQTLGRDLLFELW